MEESKKIEKEQERQRFLEYLGPQPDLTGLAEKTKITRQVLYYITTGRNSVSGTIHKEFARTFPDYDLTWQMFGVRSAKAESVGTTDDPDEQGLFRLQSKVAKLEVENEYLRKAVEDASQEKAKYWKLLESLHEQNLDFGAVSNQTTEQLFAVAPTQKVNPRFDQFRVKGEKKPVTRTWNLPGMVNLKEAIED